jgi:hypothetical protein
MSFVSSWLGQRVSLDPWLGPADSEQQMWGAGMDDVALVDEPGFRHHPL